MSRLLVNEIATLYGNGWRPFTGTISSEVYTSLPCGRMQIERAQQVLFTESKDTAQKSKNCKKPSPYWFFCGDAYLCLGCATRCALTRPAGFQFHFELRYNTQREKYTLSPQEMVHKLNQLTVEQTAYCLNISRNQVYHWIREGKLPLSRTDVYRIPVSAVRKLLEEREDE